MKFDSETRRARLRARVERLWRWEFWPGAVFYAPLVPWVAYLGQRYGGLTALTAANPGLPDSGLYGESKFDILQRLPKERIIPSAKIARGALAERKAHARSLMQDGFPLPWILKPDASHRGFGLAKAKTVGDVDDYLERIEADVLVQTYHPGPYEAGIYYVRFPDEARGRVFSLTEKHFPQVVGDGHRSLAQLIWAHPRLRMQAELFLARQDDPEGTIPAKDQVVTLSIAGNHCQGTMFKDGTAQVTPALDRAVDEMSRHIGGFHVGRYDVRYTDREAFLRGEDIKVVELNGVIGESSNLYDPDHSIWRAYRILFEQWRMVYAIGAANVARGVEPRTATSLAKHILEYKRQHVAYPIAEAGGMDG